MFTLNDKQRPGKDKEMNLRYSRSKYTNPFLFVSSSVSFFNNLEKKLQEEWPD